MAHYSISHHVSCIRQGNSNRCWAAASAMVLGGGATVESIVAIAAAARPAVRLRPNGTLDNSPANVDNFVRAVGLRVQWMMNREVTLASFAAHLRRGPFVILGGFGYPNDNAVDHAVVPVALLGDDTDLDRLLIKVADPFDGRVTEFDWSRWTDEIMADPQYFLTR